jgi:hypothetical protein
LTSKLALWTAHFCVHTCIDDKLPNTNFLLVFFSLLLTDYHKLYLIICYLINVFFMNKTSRAIKWFCYRKYLRHRNVDTNMYVPFNLQNSDNQVNSVNSSTPDYTWDRTIPIYFHQTAYHKLAQYVSWIKYRYV